MNKADRQSGDTGQRCVMEKLEQTVVMFSSNTRGVVPGPRSEERAGASSGPAAVRIPGGDAVPAGKHKNSAHLFNSSSCILLCSILAVV